MAQTKVQVIVPTAINLLTAETERLVQAKRASTVALVELPSLRSRARMVVAESGVLPIVDLADTSA